MKGILRLGSRWAVIHVRHCSSTVTPDVTDKYAESLARFAERVGKPPVRLAGIRYDGTVKRFYQHVDVEETLDGFAPTVGGRFLQTAGGYLVEVPSRMLATSIALEWHYQHKMIKPHLMPLMHMATQAIDQVPQKRHDMLRTMLTYVNFDSACTRDFDLPILARAQEKYLDPVVAWFDDENYLDIDPIKQSAETTKAIETRLSELTDWEYAVFDQCCGVSKSIIISLAILEGQLDLTRAFECARLEENYAMRKNGKIGGALGHDIDIDFVRTRLAAARSFINMINCDTQPIHKTFSQRNSFVNEPPKPQGKTLSKLMNANEDEFV